MFFLQCSLGLNTSESTKDIFKSAVAAQCVVLQADVSFEKESTGVN